MGSAPAASRAPTPNAGVGAADLRTRQRNKFGDVLPLFCLFSRRRDENQEEAEHGVASPVTLPDAGSTPAASTIDVYHREKNPRKTGVFRFQKSRPYTTVHFGCRTQTRTISKPAHPRNDAPAGMTDDGDGAVGKASKLTK